MRPLLLIAALTFSAGLASAQDTPGACRQVRPGRVECAPINVVGHTPNSFYLLSRSRVEYRPPTLRRELVGEVRRSVRRSPF